MFCRLSCAWTTCMPRALRGQESVSDPLQLELNPSYLKEQVLQTVEHLHSPYIKYSTSETLSSFPCF